MKHSVSPSSQALNDTIDVALRSTPDARAVLIDVSDLSIIAKDDRGDITLPWSSYDVGTSTELLELFDRESAEDIVSALARADQTLTARTTARTNAGQPVDVGIYRFAPDSPWAITLFDESAILTPAPASDPYALNTRIVCSADGQVVSIDGPPGSYAHTNIELGPFGERLISSEDRGEFRNAVAKTLDGEPYALLQVCGAGPGLHFQAMLMRVDENLLIDLKDHSHQVAAVSALKRSQVQFNQLSETLPVGVFVVEAEGKMTFASSRLREMFGPQLDSVFGWLDVIHPDDQANAAQAFADLPEKRQINLEVRATRVDGELRWVRLAGRDLRDDQGVLQHIVGFVEDVSEWRDLHDRIAYQASFDGLTDLPNRTTLVEDLRDRLQSQTPDTLTGVLFIDLDGFKLINDTQGHSVGDIVLLEVAQRFRRALRPNDLIGRFGGDEFVVVASDITGPEEADAIGRRLHDILSTPVLADGRIITVNASIGIALSEHEASTSEQLIGDADIAMYEAKASGRNRSVLFDATLRARASQRFDMTADLRHARRRRELRLEYQPIVDLNTNRLEGVEALVRWEHPAMGRISPAVFIPLAEEIGLIDDVGEWVVEQACADLDRLRGRGLVEDDFTISINASAQQFANVAILATSSLASLDQFGLRPSNLRFELTESVPLTQIPDAASRIRQLTNYGFGLAIDDFGTGYSSLGYLTMLPFDVLKLDLSLTAQLEPGAPALAVVDSLTRMAAEMEFEIVAEGIETDKQQALLCDAGVRLGQGYHISRPLPLSQLIDRIEEFRENGGDRSSFG